MSLRSRCAFLLLTVALLATFALPAHAQFTTVTATNIQNGDGLPLALGTMCWLGANNSGQPIGYRGGGSGQVTTNPVCRDVINGAVQTTYRGTTIGVLKVADTTATQPANVCYKVTITDSSKGTVVLGSFGGQKSGYDCVQPTGPTWSFDTFIPNTTPNVLQTTGPQGPKGDTAVSTSNGTNGGFAVPGDLTHGIDLSACSTDFTACLQAAHDRVAQGGDIKLPPTSAGYNVTTVNLNRGAFFTGSGVPSWNSSNEPTKINGTSTSGFAFLAQSTSGNTTVQQQGPTWDRLTIVDATNSGAGGLSPGAINISSTNRWSVLNSDIRGFSGASAVGINIDGSATTSTDASYGLIWNLKCALTTKCIVSKQGGFYLGGGGEISGTSVGLDASDSTNNEIRVVWHKFEVPTGATGIQANGGMENYEAMFEPGAPPTNANTIGFDGFPALRNSRVVALCNKCTTLVRLQAGASSTRVEVDGISLGTPLADFGDGTLASRPNDFWYLNSLVSGARSGVGFHVVQEANGTRNIDFFNATGGMFTKDSGQIVPITACSRTTNVTTCTTQRAASPAWGSGTEVVLKDVPNGTGGTSFSGVHSITVIDSTHFSYSDTAANDSTPATGGGWAALSGGKFEYCPTANRCLTAWGAAGASPSVMVAYASIASIMDMNAGVLRFYSDTGLTYGSVYSATCRWLMDGSGNVTPCVAGTGSQGTSLVPWGNSYIGPSPAASFHYDTTALTAQRSIAVPDKSGTLAMTSDITAASGNTNSFADVADHAITGTAADQTVYTISMSAGLVKAAKGFDLNLVWARTAGTGSQTVKVVLDATTLWTCTYTNTTTGNPAVLQLRVNNQSGVQNSQKVWAMPVSINTSTVCGTTAGTAAVDLSLAKNLTVVYNAAATEQVTFKALTQDLHQ